MRPSLLSFSEKRLSFVQPCSVRVTQSSQGTCLLWFHLGTEECCSTISWVGRNIVLIKPNLVPMAKYVLNLLGYMWKSTCIFINCFSSFSFLLKCLYLGYCLPKRNDSLLVPDSTITSGESRPLPWLLNVSLWNNREEFSLLLWVGKQKSKHFLHYLIQNTLYKSLGS